MSPLPGGRLHCDPMWHLSSRSSVAILRTAIHLLLTYMRTHATIWKISNTDISRFFEKNELSSSLAGKSSPRDTRLTRTTPDCLEMIRP